MTTATNKLAQIATGSKTCKGCGKTKQLDRFAIHGRWGTPIHLCDACMADRRKQAGQKRSAQFAKQREKRQLIEANEKATAAVNAAAKLAATPAIIEAKPIVATTSNARVALAKLEGYAMGVRDDALRSLLDELAEAIHHA